MSQDNFESAYQLLTSRVVWETKQRMYYQMRHSGLPRINRPFPNCADGHVALIDMAIRKLKPYLLGQITSGDKLCNFTSLKGELAAFSDAAANFFDYIINQKTPFLRKMRVVADSVFLRGRGVIKATIDPLNDYAIVMEAIDPMFILMPQEADNFEDAVEFVHVRQMPVATYKLLDSRWDTTPSTIAKIRGQEVANLTIYVQQKKLTEGITHTTNTNQVIIFEHWVKTKGGHTIYTYSPHAPDIQLRKPYGNPYKCAGKESVPFFSFQMEVCAEGWYAPRGVSELIAPDEQFSTKVINEWADFLTFANRPLYTGEKEIANLQNYRWQPGEYIPGNIRGVQSSVPPISFDEMLRISRGLAEERIQVPDIGVVNPSNTNKSGSKPITAAESNRISALTQTGVGDTGMLFREDLAKLYRHLWGLMVQFKPKEFTYYAAGEVNTLPEQALHDAYLIEPDGSPDGWNRMARFQKAIGLAQATNGSPNVNPEPIWKEVLAAYGDGMVLKAFVPTNLKGANEYEDQAEKINSLLVPGSGKPPFPITVKPTDDHLSRIKCNVDWIHAAGKLRTPVDPMAKQSIQKNIADHIQMLEKQNPAAAKQIKQMLQQMEMAGQQPVNGQPQLQ
jgi:hypothetical protein